MNARPKLPWAIPSLTAFSLGLPWFLVYSLLASVLPLPMGRGFAVVWLFVLISFCLASLIVFYFQRDRLWRKSLFDAGVVFSLGMAVAAPAIFAIQFALFGGLILADEQRSSGFWFSYLIMSLPISLVMYAIAGLCVWMFTIFVAVPLGLLSAFAMRWICRNDPMPADPLKDCRHQLGHGVNLGRVADDCPSSGDAPSHVR